MSSPAISDIYVKEIIVQQEHLDDLQHVNNVVYLQWVQDIAGAHWKSKSNPAFDLLYYWVVVDHYVEYKGQAVLDDKITVKTYVERNTGVKSARIVEFCKSDKLIVKAKTHWCLVNIMTKRPVRIPKEVDKLFFSA